MIIVLDTVYELNDSDNKLAVRSGEISKISISLSSSNFDLKYKNELAEIDLVKNLSSDQARELGKILVAQADELDKSTAEYNKSYVEFMKSRLYVY